MHREGTQKTRRLLLWRVLPNAARRVRKALTWTAGKGWPPAMGDGFDEGPQPQSDGKDPLSVN